MSLISIYTTSCASSDMKYIQSELSAHPRSVNIRSLRSVLDAPPPPPPQSEKEVNITSINYRNCFGEEDVEQTITLSKIKKKTAHFSPNILRPRDAVRWYGYYLLYNKYEEDCIIQFSNTLRCFHYFLCFVT